MADFHAYEVELLNAVEVGSRDPIPSAPAYEIMPDAPTPPPVIYYKRARYDGFDPAVEFVYWQTEDPAGAYPGVPVGTLQDEVILRIGT